MNVLVIGQNTKIANVFSTFSTNVFLVPDSSAHSNKFAINRSYKENEKYTILMPTTKITSVTNIPRRMKEIRTWVRQNKIDIIFSNEKNSMISARLVFLFTSCRPLLLATSHDSRSWNNKKKVWLFSKLIALTTDGYVALAKFVYSQMTKNGVLPNKILYLPNTVESELFIKKTDYSINGKQVLMAYTAVVYPGKGQITVIKVLNDLKNKGIIANIDFIGDILDEAYKEEIIKCAYKLGVGNQFKFTGRIDNAALRSMLCRYDIYLCPSHMEMSPYNILEAKSVGLPIVASNVGGIPDLITDGVDGYLVPYDNHHEFANKVEMLANDYTLRTNMGTTAFMYTQKNNANTSGRLLKTFIESLRNIK